MTTKKKVAKKKVAKKARKPKFKKLIMMFDLEGERGQTIIRSEKQLRKEIENWVENMGKSLEGYGVEELLDTYRGEWDYGGFSIEEV
jgi:hypothetical protein